MSHLRYNCTPPRPRQNLMFRCLKSGPRKFERMPLEAVWITDGREDVLNVTFDDDTWRPRIEALMLKDPTGHFAVRIKGRRSVILCIPSGAVDTVRTVCVPKLPLQDCHGARLRRFKDIPSGCQVRFPDRRGGDFIKVDCIDISEGYYRFFVAPWAYMVWVEEEERDAAYARTQTKITHASGRC